MRPLTTAETGEELTKPLDGRGLSRTLERNDELETTETTDVVEAFGRHLLTNWPEMTAEEALTVAQVFKRAADQIVPAFTQKAPPETIGLIFDNVADELEAVFSPDEAAQVAGGIIKTIFEAIEKAHNH